ncbi:hypothetical protein AMTR_s00091p00167460 [Amborella trichopoda]|uniref:Uncharacterized protein n=1 Tax=Amborella trichopoda TaxID=13333 RepID=W1P104_AMBTC|nr:hypothetical protein AMTR_s00091p00167460 [Amborella trichopoda]
MIEFKGTEGILMIRTTFRYEKQAVKLYTHGVFRKFVEEIQKIPPMVAESIEVEGPNTTYRVYKYDVNRPQYKESQTARYDDLSRVTFKVVSNGSDSERLLEFTKNILMECNDKVERKRLEYEEEATCSNQGSNIKNVMPSHSYTPWTNTNIFILESQCTRTKGRPDTIRKKAPWEEKTSTRKYSIC